MKLDLLSKGEIQTIQDEVILKLKDLINLKNLEPGDKLPSERMLSEKFEVSRSNVREAIQLLEFYGILKSKPQSGTFIADIGQIAMNGMIDDILGLEDLGFKSLVETRILLELKTVKLAALRRTEQDLKKIEEALFAFKEKVINGQNAVQEDLLFHLAIANACGNSTINTFMLMITPKIITNFEKYHVCDKSRSHKGVEEHQAIYDAIKDQNASLAKEQMKVHFNLLYQYCYEVK